MIENLFCWIIFLFAVLLSACGTETDPARIERELAYVEAVNMNIWPENYVGKTRTVSGQSTSSYFAVTDKTYHSIAVPNKDGTYTEEVEYLTADGTYPADGIPVTVTGKFETYMENGIQYCRLKDAKIILKGDLSHE